MSISVMDIIDMDPEASSDVYRELAKGLVKLADEMDEDANENEDEDDE